MPTPDKQNEPAPLSDDSWMPKTPPNHRLSLGTRKHWGETPSFLGTPFQFINVPRNLFHDTDDWDEEEWPTESEVPLKEENVVRKVHIPLSPAWEPDFLSDWHYMVGDDKENGVCRPYIPASPSCEPEASWDLPELAA